MNVDKYVKTLTEADCRKRFPKGYFAAAEKTSKGAGTVLIVMGVLFAPIGLWLLFQLGKFLIKEVPGNSAPMTGGDIAGAIIICLIPLLIFLFGAICLWVGIKRFTCSGDEWFRLFVEQSGYTESEIREFDRQVSSPGSIAVILSEKGLPGALLTKTYFVLEPGVPMKYNDIKGAYLVDYPETIYTGKTMKKVQRRNLAVFSAEHWNFSRAYAKPEIAQRVQAMLLERNPGIDTADGRVLSDREYDAMEQEYIENGKRSRGTQSAGQ